MAVFFNIIINTAVLRRYLSVFRYGIPTDEIFNSKNFVFYSSDVRESRSRLSVWFRSRG